MNVWITILIMSISTYLIRAIPFLLMRKKIKSVFFYSFFSYIPYAVLSSMVFPSVLYSTGNITSAAVACIAATIMSFFKLPLIAVSILSSIIVFATNFIVNLI